MWSCPAEEAGLAQAGPTSPFWTLVAALNPFCWLKRGVHLTFGHFEPPDYLSDFLPLGIFYGDMRSFGLIVLAAFMLCLAVVRCSEAEGPILPRGCQCRNRKSLSKGTGSIPGQQTEGTGTSRRQHQTHSL